MLTVFVLCFQNEMITLGHLMSFPRNLLWSGRLRLVRFASTRPALYYCMRGLANWKYTGKCIAPDTNLVIEGYPRSANTWTAQGFLDHQPQGSLKLAHHKHHAAQLLRAVQCGIPAVMLIREPKGAVLSWIALKEETQQRQCRWCYIPTFSEALGDWIAFYRAVLPYSDRIVIAPFDEVLADVPSVIREVNFRFGTSFASAPCLRNREFAYHALPNALRNQIKCKVEEAFLRKLDRSPRLRTMLNEADTLHREILSRHELSRVRSSEVNELA